jgi:hypothetical protein
MGNYFFIIYVLTVLVTRIFLFLYPTPAPTIGSFRTHHYMFGIAGIIIGLFLRSIAIYAVGIGLFVDELSFLLIKGKSHSDNYSGMSLLGTVIFVIVGYFLKRYLMLPFQN